MTSALSLGISNQKEYDIIERDTQNPKVCTFGTLEKVKIKLLLLFETFKELKTFNYHIFLYQWKLLAENYDYQSASKLAEYYENQSISALGDQFVSTFLDHLQITNRIRLAASKLLGVSQRDPFKIFPNSLRKTFEEACYQDKENMVKSLLIDYTINVNSLFCYKIIERLIENKKIGMLRIFVKAGFDLYSYLDYLKTDFTPFDAQTSTAIRINSKELKPIDLIVLLQAEASMFCVNTRNRLTKDRHDLRFVFFISGISNDIPNRILVNNEMALQMRNRFYRELQQNLFTLKIHYCRNTLKSLEIPEVHSDIITSYLDITISEMRDLTTSDSKILIVLTKLDFFVKALNPNHHSHAHLALYQLFCITQKMKTDSLPLSNEFWDQLYEYDQQRRIALQNKIVVVNKENERKEQGAVSLILGNY